MLKKLRIDLQTVEGTTVASHTYTEADEPLTIEEMIPDGYLLASGQPLLSKLPANQEQVTYLLRHRVVTVSANDAKRAGEIMAGTTAKTYPAGLGEADLKRTVKRVIIVKSVTGSVLQQTENQVTFMREAQVDAVTGKVTYSPWSYNGRAVLPGYLAQPHDGETIEAVNAIEVTPDSQDLEVTIQYRKVQARIKIMYRDAVDNKVVDVDNRPRVENEMVTLFAPKGYALNTDSDQLRIGTANEQAYEVLVHQVG